MGSYNGDEQGSLVISVQKSGTFSGNYGANNDIVLGTVQDDGIVTSVVSQTPQFLLSGSLVLKKGTWRYQEKKGSWTLTKQ